MGVPVLHGSSKHSSERIKVQIACQLPTYSVNKQQREVNAGLGWPYLAPANAAFFYTIAYLASNGFFAHRA
jgi:hypothetical protein